MSLGLKVRNLEEGGWRSERDYMKSSSMLGAQPLTRIVRLTAKSAVSEQGHASQGGGLGIA